MWIVQSLDGQFFHDLNSLSRSAKSVERKRIGHRGIYFSWCTLVGFFGQALSLSGVLIYQEPKTSVIRCYADFGRRTFMKTLRNPVEVLEIVVIAINAKERVEGLTPRRIILRNAQPKLLSFNSQIPLHREPR